MLSDRAAIKDVGAELMARYGTALASISTLALAELAVSSLVLWVSCPTTT
jgi:hypothetical protein